MSTVAANACDYPYLVLMVDWGASLEETDETNNTASAAIDCRPDLILTEFTLDSFTPTGINYSWTLKNVGIVSAVLKGPTGADADNVSVQALLSDDTIFNNAGDSPAGGTIVGNSPLADLAPGPPPSAVRALRRRPAADDADVAPLVERAPKTDRCDPACPNVL